jgi:hypothetical protein
MGKGSDRRSRSVYCSSEEFNKRWDSIFLQKDTATEDNDEHNNDMDNEIKGQK